MTMAPLPGAGAELLTFPGICDASAAIAIDARTLIVADDERRKLYVYDLATQGLREEIPLPSLSKNSGGGASDGKSEADLEGATIFKDRIVWISSHGRNSEGEVRPCRMQLFASHRIDRANGTVEAAFSAAFTGLLPMILGATDPNYAPLREAIGDLSRPDADLAPKKRGLNIEGLTAARDGDALLIGLRNPQRNGKALLFELKGFDRFLNGDPGKLALGRVSEVDLGGRSIRDITWSPAHQSYIIVAGQVVDRIPGPGFALFKWDGTGPALEIGTFQDLDGNFQSEAITPLFDRAGDGLVPSKNVLILSDEGEALLDDGCRCKKADKGRRRFRGVALQVD